MELWQVWTADFPYGHGEILLKLCPRGDGIMINAGNVAFILMSVTFVFLMTPGLAFFYGGLSRRKNVLNTMMSSIFIIGLASVMWVLIGYSLSFSGDIGGIIGTLKSIGLNDVGLEPGAYSGASVRSLSDDVRHHHTGADYGRSGWKNAL